MATMSDEALQMFQSNVYVSLFQYTMLKIDLFLK